MQEDSHSLCLSPAQFAIELFGQVDHRFLRVYSCAGGINPVVVRNYIDLNAVLFELSYYELRSLALEGRLLDLEDLASALGNFVDQIRAQRGDAMSPHTVAGRKFRRHLSVSPRKSRKAIFQAWLAVPGSGLSWQTLLSTSCDAAAVPPATRYRSIRMQKL
ncbi:hypothetical protein D9M70_582430 [compost metagenome]